MPFDCENTCTPVADPVLPSAVTETKTVPSFETAASNGFPAVATSVEVAVKLGVMTGGGVIMPAPAPPQPPPASSKAPNEESIRTVRKRVVRLVGPSPVFVVQESMTRFDALCHGQVVVPSSAVPSRML